MKHEYRVCLETTRDDDHRYTVIAIPVNDDGSALSDKERKQYLARGPVAGKTLSELRVDYVNMGKAFDRKIVNPTGKEISEVEYVEARNTEQLEAAKESIGGA